MKQTLAGLALALLVAACIGTTGSSLVMFDAAASGVEGASAPFTNGRGWTITLTKARLRVGALYLNRSVPVSGGQERECFLPGVYVAQLTEGADIDALSTALQPFPTRGDGTEDRAVTGEVWLTGGRVDALEDSTAIADIAGTAVRGAESMRFEAKVTIGSNRRQASTDPARPGSSPLCSLRIVTPIPVDLTPHDGGQLILRIDPRAWFSNVELAELEPVSTESDLRRFPDDNAQSPSANLFSGLRAATGPYRFEFTSQVR